MLRHASQVMVVHGVGESLGASGQLFTSLRRAVDSIRTITLEQQISTLETPGEGSPTPE